MVIVTMRNTIQLWVVGVGPLLQTFEIGTQGFFVSLGDTDSPSKHFRSLKASSLLCRTPSPSHSRCLSSSLSVLCEESDAARLQ